ncbi:MAG: hypothetical protein OEX18_15035 [Candidatus Krumholzibacteria bacterium]|nr:hypothetical protein [Candidatus Krumholzibacteria bacterium]MDH4338583.1 hypothetical protein [Candidatus Krumholzibacteria bacterium]
MASMPASNHSTESSFSAAFATASMPGLTSRPATTPLSPTSLAASRATMPVPHATSSTRSPGLSCAARTSLSASGFPITGTK